MKRDATELNTENSNTSTKRAKITKTLPALLVEVSNRQYDDFRAWLVQTNCTSLDLEGQVMTVNLTHLGQALKGTAVTSVSLPENDIGFTATGANDFAKALKGTNVTTVDISCNDIDSTGAKDFMLALKGTPVTDVNLAVNNINNTGAVTLLNSLEGTQITSINLQLNNIKPIMAMTLAALIEKTQLLNLDLPFVHPAITEALKRNQQKMLATPYYAAHRWWSLLDEEKQPLALPALTDQSKELQYAHGIIMQLPQKIATNIVSYLPAMNQEIAKNIFRAAYLKRDAEVGKSEDVINEVKNLMGMTIR